MKTTKDLKTEGNAINYVVVESLPCLLLATDDRIKLHFSLLLFWPFSMAVSANPSKLLWDQCLHLQNEFKVHVPQYFTLQRSTSKENPLDFYSVQLIVRLRKSIVSVSERKRKDNESS
jgi:hypothetical protein